MKMLVNCFLAATLLLAGCKGSKGDVGAVGADGIAGVQGPSGLVGPAGADGTVITVVQFCPGSVPVYPSVFPEVGLLISGTIYGVYSANGGFLSPLPAGVYSSSAVGSICTFTINSDGSISN